MTDEPKKESEARDDIKRHGGALTGAVVGGLLGSIVPGIGTVIGAGLGAWVGHLNDESREEKK